MMSRNMAAGIQQWFTGYVFDIGHPCYGQLTAVKARYLTSITWPYRGLRFRVYWGLRFISVYRWPNKLFAIDFFLNLIPFFFSAVSKKNTHLSYIFEETRVSCCIPWRAVPWSYQWNQLIEINLGMSFNIHLLFSLTQSLLHCTSAGSQGQ